MSPVHPKKSLGQHFLKDENIARKIVGSLKCEGITQVVEVGPGTGILTKYLFESKRFNTTIVEIDNESYAHLITLYPEKINNIRCQDILTFDFKYFGNKTIAVIGNFPYHISSPLFFKILHDKDIVAEVVCMIQKEVADRIIAPPGSKTYGILSVLLQAYYNIENLFTVSPHVFIPPPKVKSSVIRLTRNNISKLDCSEDLFFKVVKTCFNQRRKMIRNSVRNLIPGDIPEHELFHNRPEQLSVDRFVELTCMIEDII